MERVFALAGENGWSRVYWMTRESNEVARRLYDLLTGKDASPRFAPLAAADRRAILEILRETKTGLPEYWLRPISSK